MAIKKNAIEWFFHVALFVLQFFSKWNVFLLLLQSFHTHSKGIERVKTLTWRVLAQFTDVQRGRIDIKDEAVSEMSYRLFYRLHLQKSSLFTRQLMNDDKISLKELKKPGSSVANW